MLAQYTVQKCAGRALGWLIADILSGERLENRANALSNGYSLNAYAAIRQKIRHENRNYFRYARADA
jgi:hypothetical protein